MGELLTDQASVSSAKQVVESKRRLWFVATLLAGTIACVKGWQSPSEWALTFTQLSYRYGFIKRGLPGTLYDLAGLHDRSRLVWIFTLQLLLLLAAIGLLCYQTQRHRRDSANILIPLFAGSPAVTMLAVIRGYTDIPLALATVALLLVRSPNLRFILALVVVPASVLSHEAYILWLLPILLLSFALDALKEKTRVRRAACYALALALIAVALTVATSLRQNMTGRQVRTMAHDMSTRTDIAPTLEPLYVLSRSLGDNWKMVAAIHSNSIWRRKELDFALELLPTCLILLYVLRRAVRLLLAGFPPSVRLGTKAGLAVILITPLSLHLLAWDAARFNSLATLALFLTLLLICRYLPERALSISTFERNVISFVIAFNLFTNVHFI